MFVEMGWLGNGDCDFDGMGALSSPSKMRA